VDGICHNAWRFVTTFVGRKGSFRLMPVPEIAETEPFRPTFAHKTCAL
jgi:hypothetical protein